MRNRIAGLALVFLGGCQQSEVVTRTEYERLETRVAQLEQRVATLSEEQSKPKPIQQPEPKPVVPAAPAVPRTTYQLLGMGNQVGPLRYSSAGACERAKQTLIDTWNEQDNRNRERGIFTVRATLVCVHHYQGLLVRRAFTFSASAALRSIPPIPKAV